jgi:hypothetical protein
MTVTTGTFGGRRAKLASLSGHPELVAVAAVLAAWVRPIAGQCASHPPAAAAVALRRGFVFGLCCLGTCWCLMLIPLAPLVSARAAYSETS